MEGKERERRCRCGEHKQILGESREKFLQEEFEGEEKKPDKKNNLQIL